METASIFIFPPIFFSLYLWYAAFRRIWHGPHGTFPHFTMWSPQIPQLPLIILSTLYAPCFFLRWNQLIDLWSGPLILTILNCLWRFRLVPITIYRFLTAFLSSNYVEHKFDNVNEDKFLMENMIPWFTWYSFVKD